MNWNHWIRQVHRWLSIFFTLAVILNIAMMGKEQAPMWVGFLALFPLIILLLSGLYLFVLPYTARWRAGRRAAERST
jgi:hypothetical protein